MQYIGAQPQYILCYRRGSAPPIALHAMALEGPPAPLTKQYICSEEGAQPLLKQIYSQVFVEYYGAFGPIILSQIL